MTTQPVDELWPHFAALWSDLRTIAPGVLLAGGYALFLKQRWLAMTNTPTLVMLDRWHFHAPRVTNDLDFVAELDVIASPAEQRQVDAALTRHGFKVVEQNRRWQFEKWLDAARNIVIDFHASPPAMRRDDVRVESRRVKPHPSLGQVGIHGRENPEAAGSELSPFLFHVDEVEIAIPHPVSMLIMKLIAARDRRAASHDVSKPSHQRNYDDAQAFKHAQDVGRVVAMISRAENDVAEKVVAVLRDTPTFAAASQVCAEVFGSDEGWGFQLVGRLWNPDDAALIRAKLHSWFQT